MATILKSDAANAPAKATTDAASATPPTVPAEGLPQGGVVGRVPGGVVGLASFNMDDLAQNSLDQLDRCRQHIQEMLADAERQAKKIAEDAKQQGYADGTAQANVDVDAKIARAAEAKAKSQLASLHQAVDQMHEQYNAWMQSYAETLTDMVLAATQRIVQGQLDDEMNRSDTHAAGPTIDNDPAMTDETIDPTPSREPLVARWAREALHSTRSASRLTLAVHPETLAEIGETLDVLLANPDLPESSTVVPDPTLAVGDVVVRQDGGEIRAGLTAQLQRLREATS